MLLMSRKDKADISQLKVLGMDKVVKRDIEMLGLIMKMIVMRRVIQRILMSLR